MTTHLLNRSDFEKNRARDRTSNDSAYVLIGSRLEREYANPSHRSRLPHVPSIAKVERERRGISISSGGKPKVLGPRYGPASQPITTSPTAVDASLRDTSRPVLWRDPASQRRNVSPKARQIRRVDPYGPFSEDDFTRPRRPEDSATSTVAAEISSTFTQSPGIGRNVPDRNVPTTDGGNGADVLLSARQVKSVDIWPRKKQYVTLETAEQEREAKQKAIKTFTGTLSRELLTGGYGESSTTARSRLQEDFDWPCEKSHLKMFVRGGGLEHTEGHGHALACEHMKGFRGGDSRFDHMASGGGVGHDHGATRKSRVKNFGK